MRAHWLNALGGTVNRFTRPRPNRIFRDCHHRVDDSAADPMRQRLSERPRNVGARSGGVSRGGWLLGHPPPAVRSHRSPTHGEHRRPSVSRLALAEFGREQLGLKAWWLGAKLEP